MAKIRKNKPNEARMPKRIGPERLQEIQEIKEDILSLQARTQERKALLQVRTSEALRQINARISSNAICLDCGTVLKIFTAGGQKMTDPCPTCAGAMQAKVVAAQLQAQ